MFRWRNIKIHVRMEDHRRHITIVPIQEFEDGGVAVGYIKDGDFVMHRFSDGQQIPDEKDGAKFLTIPDTWGKSLLEGLIAEIGHPEKTATEQGLEATKYHLEDMRKLVFEQRIKTDAPL